MKRESTIEKKKAGTWKAVITILFLCMTVIASDKMPAGTVQAETSGDYEYEVNDDDTVTITKYTGSATTLVIPSTLDGKKVTIIRSKNYSDTVFSKDNRLTKITIPSGVTHIGKWAFYGCSSLTSITIPESVTYIGTYAFRDCSNLTSITIPESVTDIRDYAFYGCSSLTSITIPGSVTEIWQYAFSDCSSLTSITIHEGVTTIGSDAFLGCNNLTSITIPESVTYIGSMAFLGCSNLTSIEVKNGNPKYDSRNNCNAIIVTETNKLLVGCCNTIIPENVTFIEAAAFMYCSNLTNIIIPEGVTGIGKRAFAGCSSLTNITIPDGVTTIGDEAFLSCHSLTSIVIPESVTKMWNAFLDCSSLTSIEVKSGNPKYDSRNNCNAIIDTETNTLLIGCCNTIIPESITTIGAYSFVNCDSLTSINIPEGVTTIRYGAFYCCSNLTSITIPSSVTTIGNDTFSGCSSLTSITIPEGVTTIQHDTFSGCSSLTNITIPSSVTTIEEDAFSGCSSLTSITIPSNVTWMGANVFSGCPNTMIVYADADSRAAEYAKANGFTVEPIEKNPTNDNTTPSASGTILTASDSQCTVKVVSSDADNPTVTYTGTTNKTAATVTIPDTVTVDNITYKITGIAENAFKNNKKITKVTIGANIITIGANAFNGCTKLKTVSIGADVTTIQAKAFYKCTKLTKITIPAKVETIGKQAFYGCKKLKTITIKTTKLTKKKVGSKAFKGIYSKASIKVPKKKLSNYKKILKAKGVGSKAKIKK